MALPARAGARAVVLNEDWPAGIAIPQDLCFALAL
jgi:hypothetical protein